MAAEFFILQNGGTPRSRVLKFLQEMKVPENDKIRHEYGVLMDILEMAIEYDQVDVSSLACFEVLARRVQMIEQAYSANPRQPRWEGQEHFMGIGQRGSATMPGLRAHAAQGLSADALLAKEARKAREEAAAAAKNNK